jgi:hypothetical protein
MDSAQSLRFEQGRCKLISRNGNEFKSFRTLSESLGQELKHNAVLDGEIVCVGPDGKSQFYDLFFRHLLKLRTIAFTAGFVVLPLLSDDRQLMLAQFCWQCSDPYIFH